VRERLQQAEFRGAQRDLFACRIRKAVAGEIEPVARELEKRLSGLRPRLGRERLANAREQSRLV
jgi:hypothetical protein